MDTHESVVSNVGARRVELLQTNHVYIRMHSVVGFQQEWVFDGNNHGGSEVGDAGGVRDSEVGGAGGRLRLVMFVAQVLKGESQK